MGGLLERRPPAGVQTATFLQGFQKHASCLGLVQSTPVSKPSLSTGEVQNRGFVLTFHGDPSYPHTLVFLPHSLSGTFCSVGQPLGSPPIPGSPCTTVHSRPSPTRDPTGLPHFRVESYTGGPFPSSLAFVQIWSLGQLLYGTNSSSSWGASSSRAGTRLASLGTAAWPSTAMVTQ